MKKSDKVIVLFFIVIVFSIFGMAGVTVYKYYTFENNNLNNVSEIKDKPFNLDDNFIENAIKDGCNNDFTKKFVLPKISEGNNKDVKLVIIGTPYYKIALQAYMNNIKYNETLSIDNVKAKFDELEIYDTIFFSAKFDKANGSDARIVLLQNDERVEGKEVKSDNQGIILKKYNVKDINLGKTAVLRVQDKYNESLYDEYKVDFTMYN